MRAIDENTITDAAIEQMSSTRNPRLKQIMAAAVRHLHAFAREVDLTPEEWLEGIRFLTATGQMSNAYRQEFILLSDTLGLSSLVNSLHDKRAVESSTKSSLLGPFYRQDSPRFDLGQSIAVKAKGPESAFTGASPMPRAKASQTPPSRSGSPTRTATTTCKSTIPRKWICAADFSPMPKAATICARFVRSAT